AGLEVVQQQRRRAEAALRPGVGGAALEGRDAVEARAGRGGHAPRSYRVGANGSRMRGASLEDPVMRLCASIGCALLVLVPSAHSQIVFGPSQTTTLVGNVAPDFAAADFDGDGFDD